jgi:hypothetical protein
MTTLEAVIASLRAAAEADRQEFIEHLHAIQAVDVRIATAAATRAVETQRMLDHLAKTGPQFPIQPDDDPTTVEIELATAAQHAARRSHLQHALAHLTQVEAH